MLYRLKIVFVDNEEVVLENTEKHGFSDDLELFEVTTVDEILVVPIKQIKYISCDSKIFKNKQIIYSEKRYRSVEQLAHSSLLLTVSFFTP